ncbi:MAG: hypothetical protein HYZ83_01835 [Candidatus Omnitrophica bacterium]|nr:hypothetical protein [Candidatus Omnitrophota bacterium]
MKKLFFLALSLFIFMIPNVLVAYEANSSDSNSDLPDYSDLIPTVDSGGVSVRPVESQPSRQDTSPIVVETDYQD